MVVYSRHSPLHSNAGHRLSQSGDAWLVALRCGAQYAMILRRVGLQRQPSLSTNAE